MHEGERKLQDLGQIPISMKSAWGTRFLLTTFYGYCLPLFRVFQDGGSGSLRLPYCMDSLRGIIASQLGDDVETIIAGGAGFEGPVKKVLDVTFGYGPDMIGVSVAELGGFCLFFFIIFAVSINVLNFQKR